MYNKLFTKILDSSIWLEPTHTRLVWLTLIAAMDEDGFAQFASVANLAHRARLTESETQEAIECLSSPDPNSSDPEWEGRRIERVPGGWMVLNSAKYKEIVTRAVAKEKTRIRVARFRESKKHVTKRNAMVTVEKRSVTPSDTETDTHSNSDSKTEVPTTSPGVREGKNGDSVPTTEQSKRIATIFHRKLTTSWSKEEIRAYKSIGTLDPEDLSALESYYAFNWPPRRDVNVLRHNLDTFLNNIQSEIDRANAWAEARKKGGKHGPLPPEDMPPILEP